MKLHSSAVLKLLQIYQNYGGFDSEKKLRDHIESLDFVVYERKQTANGESVLVLTDDYLRELAKKK